MLSKGTSLINKQIKPSLTSTKTFLKRPKNINREKDMGRAPCCDKANVKRGPWSPEEDEKLKDYMDKHGTGGNWIAFPPKAGLRRCGKSCRLRWLNYLRPNIKHGEFSDDEDRIICSLFAKIGSRWSIIAAQLPGRTDNDIKNYWNTKLKKKLFQVTPNQHLSLRNNHNNHSLLKNYSMPFQYSSIHSQISQAYECGNNNYYPSIAFSTPNSTTTNASSLLQAQDGCLGPTQVGYNQVKHSNKSNFLIFGGEAASCSSSDGSCTTNQLSDNLGLQSYFNNGNESHKLLIGDEKAGANGCYSGNSLDYSIEEIKQLISTNNVCTNNLNFFANDIKTEEKEIYY